MPVLEVKSLTAGYNPSHPIVNDLSFTLDRGETLGLCGSSGCGKTTVIWAVLGMLRRYGGYAHGQVIYDDCNLLACTEAQWKTLRWKKLALVPQSSMSTLNPVYTIKRTFVETLKAHRRYDISALNTVGTLLESVGLGADTLRHYPHELSGGMRQRVSIALAILLDPDVLILDEATTGLDVIIEADILKLLHTIQQQRHFSMVFVSHDRRITGEFCHRRIEL